MLSLSTSNIKSITEKEDAKTLTVEETFSFSTGDTINGFNAPNTAYVDASAVEYPKIEDLSLHLFAFIKPYKGEQEEIQLEVIRLNYTDGTRSLSQSDFDNPEFDYSDIAYKWNINIPDKQGVIETYLVALTLDDSTSSFYYDTTEQVIKKVVDGQVTNVEDFYAMIKTIINEASKKCLFIPLISQTFSIIENKIMRLYKEDCEDKKLLTKLMFLENIIRIGANAAINEAEVGLYMSAQENVEMLEDIINENEHLWK